MALSGSIENGTGIMQFGNCLHPEYQGLVINRPQHFLHLVKLAIKAQDAMRAFCK